MKEIMSSTRLFIAYSRKDSELLDELKIYLKPLVRKYNLRIWDDKEIDAGATWEQEIKKNLNSADIFLFMISAQSLASNYFHDKELAHAIDRHKKGEVTIIPIIMRSCDWTSSKIAELQVLPQDGKPVISSHWPYKSEAYYNIVDGIKRVLVQRDEARILQLQAEKEKEIALAKEAERLRKEAEQQKIQAELDKKKKAEEAKKYQEELNEWKKTKADNKITVYQNFIKKYPTSEFKETAKNNIKLLRNRNKKAKQKASSPKPTTSSLNLKSTTFSKNKAPGIISQVEKEETVLEKGLIIIEHSFYAALPVIGIALITMIGDNFQVPLIQSLLNFQLIYVGLIVGIIIFLIFQLIDVADEYSLIVNEETEVKETIWGIILTLISFGALSALGIFIMSAILDFVS